jgi:hypothetical protein
VGNLKYDRVTKARFFASLSKRPDNHMRGVETRVSRLRNYINGSGQLNDMQHITSKTMLLADDEEQSKPSYSVRL